jgi:hypothetical protein
MHEIYAFKYEIHKSQSIIIQITEVTVQLCISGLGKWKLLDFVV